MKKEIPDYMKICARIESCKQDLQHLRRVLKATGLADEVYWYAWQCDTEKQFRANYPKEYRRAQRLGILQEVLMSMNTYRSMREENITKEVAAEYAYCNVKD